MRKKIVLSANTSWYIFNFRASTIQALQDKGFDVVCFSPEDDYSRKLVHELGCEWQHLEMDNKGSNPLKDFVLFSRFIRFYLSVKPLAVFHFTIKNNIYGTLACHMLGIRAINNISGLGTSFINKNLTSQVVKAFYRISQPFAFKVFCQNPEDFDLLVNNKLVSESKLTLLPGSGVDTIRFSPIKKSKPTSSKSFTFLYVGRMLGDKGLRELVEATDSLYHAGHKFTLNLCGFAGVQNKSAISEEELNEISERPYINWLGPSDKVEEVYSNADCVVLPSYREGMPRSLLEAGAMGLPCIATNVPGCKHVIEDGFNGLICQVKNSQSLFEQMEAMLNMSVQRYSEMCTNSRKRVEIEYDEKIVVQHAIDSVFDLLSQKNSKTSYNQS